MSETTQTPSNSKIVTMTDGRQVEFGEKTKIKKDYWTDATTSLVHTRIDFSNGDTVTVVVDPTSEIGRAAVGHGISQKLGDAAAGAESVEDAVEAIVEVAKRIQAGEWNKTREGSGGGSAKGSSELVQALMVVLEKDKETVRTLMASLTAADKAALRKTPAIADEIEKIKAAKAPSKTEAERVAKGNDLLGALKSALSGGAPAGAAPEEALM